MRFYYPVVHNSQNKKKFYDPNSFSIKLKQLTTSYDKRVLFLLTFFPRQNGKKTRLTLINYIQCPILFFFFILLYSLHKNGNIFSILKMGLVV